MDMSNLDTSVETETEMEQNPGITVETLADERHYLWVPPDETQVLVPSNENLEPDNTMFYPFGENDPNYEVVVGQDLLTPTTTDQVYQEDLCTFDLYDGRIEVSGEQGQGQQAEVGTVVAAEGDHNVEKARSKFSRVLGKIAKSSKDSDDEYEYEDSSVAVTAAEQDTTKSGSYLVGLLDRRVDVGKFAGEDGVPLYPICRAWLQDLDTHTHLNINTLNKKKSRSASPEIRRKFVPKLQQKTSMDCQYSSMIQGLGNRGGIGDAEEQENYNSNRIYKLPSPEPKTSTFVDCDGHGKQQIDQYPCFSKPSKADAKESLDEILSGKEREFPLPTELFKSHLFHWKEMKQTYNQHRSEYQQNRYGKSFNILEDIFNPNFREGNNTNEVTSVGVEGEKDVGQTIAETD